MGTLVLFGECRLTRALGPRSTWLSSRSRTARFPSGSACVLTTRSGTTSRSATGVARRSASKCWPYLVAWKLAAGQGKFCGRHHQQLEWFLCSRADDDESVMMIWFEAGYHGRHSLVCGRPGLSSSCCSAGLLGCNGQLDFAL